MVTGGFDSLPPNNLATRLPVFAPGSMIVVTEKPDVTFVTVRQNVGPIPKLGWLLFTEEGNWILASQHENSVFLSRVVFLLDNELIKFLITKVNE